MRGVVPCPGGNCKKMLLVQLGPGERIGRHRHKEHTVLYYPSDAAEIVIKPAAGMMIYLPPGTVHQVPKVDKDRLSVAMLVHIE